MGDDPDRTLGRIDLKDLVGDDPIETESAEDIELAFHARSCNVTACRIGLRGQMAHHQQKPTDHGYSDQDGDQYLPFLSSD